MTTSEMKFNRIEFDSEVTEYSEGDKWHGLRLKTLLVYNEMKFIWKKKENNNKTNLIIVYNNEN